MARLIMVGKCPNCGAQITSRYPFEIGLCHCRGNPVEVPLQLAIIPVPRIQKALMQVSKLSGIPVEKLAEALLKEMAEAVKRGLEVDVE